MKKYYRISFFLTLWIMITFVVTQAVAFEIDFSRRRKKLDSTEAKREPQSANFEEVAEYLPANTAGEEVVILNTEKGFIPKAIKLEKGKTYTFFVVNVNGQAKNTSFVMDAFAQYHSTYFGKIKVFEIKPRHEGVFTYQCPENSFEGRLVIHSGGTTSVRGLANE
ncbi:MAG: hypothetical protein KDD25_04200 [Bdellovibrionales bacterium]|nr:hypothetical protein [Bdellovibrionales bacterium]